MYGSTRVCSVCICGTSKVGTACLYATSLAKGSGCFAIPHPDPAKRATQILVHSFVESPTEGDNIYRWSVNVENSKNIIKLPDYYKHLNKNDMVWASPVGHFGAAHGTVTEDQDCLVLRANQDGCYNVLLIGTRKDDTVRKGWRGVEQHDTTLPRNILA